MKGKTILLFCFLVVLNLIPLRPKAQTVCNNYWLPVDSAWGVLPQTSSLYSGAGANPPYYRNDDDWGSMTLPFSFCFYGTSVSQVFISNNGFITWGTNSANIYNTGSSYEPQPFPLPIGPPMIAAFWADVYTVGGPGIVWYQVTNSHLIIQWDSVGGYPSSSSQENSFQIILTNGSDPILPYGNDIEVSYGQMQWAVGTASGGTGGFGNGAGTDPAIAGINEGNGTGSIQYGAFATATSNYTGPYPARPYDGVYWLNGKTFFMNSCTGNAPPYEAAGANACDTFKICEGDTVRSSYLFYSVISPITTVLAAPVIPGESIIYNNSYVSGGSQADSVVVQIIGSAANAGVHTLGLYSFDNTAPADTLYTPLVVDISPSPAVTISAVKDTVCLGDSSVLTAGGGLTYLWSTGGTGSSITVAPAATQTYSVAISTSGCTKDTTVQVVVEAPLVLTVSPTSPGACGGNAVTLIASGASSYTWLPNSGLSCYSCSSPVANPSVTTVYTITGTANGCSATITDTVKVYPLPVITATTSADSICIGDSVNLSASGAVTYSWAPSTGLSCTNCANPVANPAGSTIYTVTGKAANGCTATAAVSVNTSPLAVLSISSNVSICPGRSVSLYASGNGNTFTWSPGNETGPYLTVSPASTQTYTVTMTSGCGNPSDTVTVYVNPQPVPSFYADINSGCVPLCIQFRNTSTISSGSITTWNWNFGSGDTTNSKNPIYCYQNPGLYSVILTTTSDSGCSSTLNRNDLITVYSYPNVSFTASPQPTTMLQPTIQFTNTSTDAYGIAGLSWSFGDATDSTSSLQNPSHTYQDTGTYCARLFETNVHGCVDSATDCLVIGPDYCLYIPEAFSPNGDGVNDVFEAKGNDVKDFEMYIFDRWGTQLFHSTSISNGWDGKANNTGALCQEDAYVYLITVYDAKNQKHTYMGSVNLIK